MKRPRWRIAAASAALALAWTAAVLSVYLVTPYGDFSAPAVINYERGVSTRDLAAELERRGVVRSRWLFLAARALRLGEVLMAGEYRFEEPLSAWAAYGKIAAGRVRQFPFTAPEGLTRFEIAELVEKAGLGEAERFLEIAADPSAVRDLAPGAESLEGFLFPDTYLFPRHTGARAVVKAMLGRFRTVFDELSGAAESGLTPYEAVILASMIEKESARGSERKLISSVFHNRLRRRMLLQCDPTVIYGLIVEDRYRGRIYRSDLNDPHRYNTYVHPGLPPGPIANPGRGSIEAALDPAASEFLYFVAQADGATRHVFSSSLQAHNQAVTAYRRSRKQR